MMVSVESTDAYRISDQNPKREAIRSALRSPDPLARQATDLPKLGARDLEAEEAQRSDIFVRTWDPRAKE